MSAHRTYELRCPIYGFIKISDWEREVISQPAFQRLRRIRQLAWTDYVYPGAMHTRFEHSLGVMHMATMLYDAIAERSRDLLERVLGYNQDGLGRHRVLVRFAALLHDIGHSPFSHASEELFPVREGGKRFEHEEYSAAIVRKCFADVIKNHSANTNYGFTADDVANLLEGSGEAGKALFWKDIVSGQMDADRMDYLLRDSYHAGVDYGSYGWRRLLNTIQAIEVEEERGLRLGVGQGGWHAAESLILARYFMFTQVYFHKTRVAYDHHLQQALTELLPGGVFPKPVGTELDAYLNWDDWRVLGLLADGSGGDGGRRIAERNHFRRIRETAETPGVDDLDKLGKWREALGELLALEETAEKSWYKVGDKEIPVALEGQSGALPLSKFSTVISNMKPIARVMLFVRPEDRGAAEDRLKGQ